jgi:hypothetical protein
LCCPRVLAVCHGIKEVNMDRSFLERLLATTAVVGMIAADATLAARLFGFIAFDTAMFTATVVGITATIAGGIYLLARLADIDKSRLSI